MAAFQTYCYLCRAGYTARRFQADWDRPDGDARAIFARQARPEVDEAPAEQDGQHAPAASMPDASGARTSGDALTATPTGAAAEANDAPPQHSGRFSGRLAPLPQLALPATATRPCLRFVLLHMGPECSRKLPPEPCAVVAVQHEDARADGLALAACTTCLDGVPADVPVCIAYAVGGDVFFVRCDARELHRADCFGTAKGKR